MRVALFTRAWIEIITAQKDGVAIVVALFTRAWIEIPDEDEAFNIQNGRPLHEGVD